MSQFKVGQRVRIVSHTSRLCGKEGTITRIAEGLWSRHSKARGSRGVAHRVDVDGFGECWPNGNWVALMASELVPLLPPGVKLFMERLTQPVGCLDAPPPAKREREAS